MTTRITSAMVSQNVIADVNLALERLDHTQQELSTGKRINQPSDDPYGAGLAIQLKGQLAELDSYGRNVSDGTNWTTTADTALTNIANMVQRVRELLVEAGNDSFGQQARADAAAEIDQLTGAIKQEANTTVAGQYIFSGTLTSTPPYQQGTIDGFAGNGATVMRQIGPGTIVQVNTDISQLLGSGQAAGDNKLLNVLRDIAQNLRGGTTADANALRGTDLQRLDANLGTLSELQATNGATTNRLQLAGSRVADLQVSRTKLLSQTEDADIAQTMTDYSTQQASLTAALRAGANIVQSSLLDFLK
jgi:flagellar hook-associated protein 3 FlgL